MKNLTQQPVGKLLLAMAGTYLAGIIMGNLFSLAGIFWVSGLGAHAVAATTLVANPMMIVFTLTPIVSVGARVLISHAVGAQDRDKACLVVNEAFGASLILTAVVGGLLWANRVAFGQMLTTDPETASLIAVYLRWLIPAFVLQVPMSVLGSALGGAGNVRASMLAQTGATVLSIGLTPFLIYGWLGAPRLGLEGAGLSAFVSSAACMLGLLSYFARPGSYLRLRPGGWFSRPRMLWNVAKIGLPTALEMGVMGFYLTIITVLIRRFGTVEQAGFGIGQQLFEASMMPLIALSAAASVVAGQNFGAKLEKRVVASFREATLFGLVMAPVLWLILLTFSYPLCSIFSKDPLVIEAGARFLKITSFSLVPTSVVLIAFSVLSGLGNTKAALVTSTTHVVLVVIAAFVLSLRHDFSPDWLWDLMVAACYLEMLMALFFVRRQFRNRLDLPEPSMELDPREVQA